MAEEAVAARARGNGGLIKLARRALGFCLRCLQGLPLYRALARRMASPFQIRQAVAADSAQVRAQFFPDMEDPLSPQSHVTNFVAEGGREIWGTAQLVRFPFDAPRYAGYWLFSVVVLPLYRGMGIGERLTETVIERARSEGAPALSLLVFNTETRAIRLYAKLGFEMTTFLNLEEELAREMTPAGRRRIGMIKRLNSTPNGAVSDER
ncbi:MAG: GNAT family N-acetyltransferase [Anaerolineales bacterium]|nr:GNAT family N-acetyltransferase [Anaerolineales bacterium]